MISEIDNAISSKYVNKIIKLRKIWDIQKNIEADVKWAQKKEEQERKTRKSKFFKDGFN